MVGVQNASQSVSGELRAAIELAGDDSMDVAAEHPDVPEQQENKANDAEKSDGRLASSRGPSSWYGRLYRARYWRALREIRHLLSFAGRDRRAFSGHDLAKQAVFSIDFSIPYA
jgi:hypothetical protein